MPMCHYDRIGFSDIIGDWATKGTVLLIIIFKVHSILFH